MKPRIFIGSSGHADKFAAAIHTRLVKIAECTVWTEGAFALSSSTLTGLIKNLRDSDFGIFVFAPDDVATIKGELLSVPRDNVVYEAGLFSGYLTPERCFIVVPDTVKLHVPTDLLGMTLGHYEDDRADGNFESAVAPFCFKVEQEISKEGVFRGNIAYELVELAVRFECCDLITEESKRVAKKKEISAEMESFCKSNDAVSKRRLLFSDRTGFYVALLAAIRVRPEKRDWELILQMRTDRLPQGFVTHRLIDVMETLKNTKNVTATQLKRLQEWIKPLPGAASVVKRIDALA